MKPKIIYIELKSGYSDNGPAWIGKAEFSKSGQTLYFNNKALKKAHIPQASANYYDIETGESYWVSGVKKNGQDRHWAGNGKIMIDNNVITEYLAIVNFSKLDEKHFQIVNFVPTDKTRFKEKENALLGDENIRTIPREYWDSNTQKFEQQKS
jgi:hypothetical protein